jgi:hypothetical protein
MSFSCSKALYFIFLSIISTHLVAQELPNAESIIEFVRGVNKSNIPDNIVSDISVWDYSQSGKMPLIGKEYLSKNKESLQYFNTDLSFRARAFKNDSIYIFNHGELIFEKMEFDVFRFLILDIHILSPEKSIEILEKLGVDTDVIDDGMRLGRPMWIIGAERREPFAPQIWIDKEYLAVRQLYYFNLPQNNIEILELDEVEFINGFPVPRHSELKQSAERQLKIVRENIQAIDKWPERMTNLIDIIR